MPSEFAEPLPRPVPRLEREVDGLAFSEWPGRHGPLVCLTDPLGTLPDLAEALADALTPDWRILQPQLSPSLPYQAHAAETLRLLDTFGFEQTVLLGSGLAGGVALLLAAWYPTRVGGLVQVNPGLTHARWAQVAALAEEQPAWRAWLDAPPAWARLERRVACPMLRLRAASARRAVDRTRGFLASRVQSEPCC